MKYSEEQLMAFVDGELDATARAEMEAAVAFDPDLARRVAAHRDLRGRLQGAYASELEEAVPQRLIDALAPPTARPLESNVVALKNSQVRTAARNWIPRWSALAASLLVGVGVGYLAFKSKTTQPIDGEQGVLVADAALGEFLSKSLAGEHAGSGAKIGISYRSHGGNLCRSFSESGLAGIACRDGEQWRIRVLVQAAAADMSAYRTASSELPPAIRQAIDADIEGEPFDALAEREAQARGWQPR